MVRKFNVVIIVLDCVRASDFPGGAEGVDGTPYLDELRKESIVFPRSVSTASWTVPTHASILTGLYPAELGALAPGNTALNESTPMIQEFLRANGYETALISANHNLRPNLGFTRGFDHAWWAPWGVTSVRLGARDEVPYSSSDRCRLDRLRTNMFERDVQGIWSLWARLAKELPRHPWILDVASRLVQAIRNPNNHYDGRVTPWVESTFETWIRSLPRDKLAFTLLNFMDAHEPYLPDPSSLRSFRDWWSKTHIRQDVANWKCGHWIPTEDQFSAIHALYREKVRGLDVRIHRVIEALRESGRWDDTLLILTGDHGQAFGEGGFLFHGNSVDEALVRIPLWVRMPAGRFGGTVSSSWTASIDVSPTIMWEALGARFDSSPGIPLGYLVRNSRPMPVYSMSGDPGPICKDGQQEQAQVNRFAVAGYFEDFKLGCSNGGGHSKWYRVTHRGVVEVKEPNRKDSGLITLQRGVATLVQTLSSSTERPPQVIQRSSSDPIDARLRSWGYD